MLWKLNQIQNHRYEGSVNTVWCTRHLRQILQLIKASHLQNKTHLSYHYIFIFQHTWQIKNLSRREVFKVGSFFVTDNYNA